MQIKLSPRLSAVAGMVPPGAVVADIGTDHGYLPVYLVIQGISPHAIATDVKKNPLAAAENIVSLLAIEKKVDLRLGDGLSVIMPGEANVIAIAGMGASTMMKILEQSPQVLARTGRLVLQPMRDTAKIRNWLVKHDWKIIDEELVYEDSAFYEIIAAEPGSSMLTIEEVEAGPVLIKKAHPLLKGFIEEKIRNLEAIDISLANSTKAKAKDQKRELREKVNTLKRVIACL